MSAKNGWLNLESATSVIPDNQFFEGDSAFKFLGLTRMQRLYGFIGCLVLGFALSLLGGILLIFGMILSFALAFAFGTIISLIGTGFLIGFTTQLKLMFKPIRVIATIVFLVSLGLVFVGAFVIGQAGVTIVFVIIEYLAYTWYTLSYIPYARTAVRKAMPF